MEKTLMQHIEEYIKPENIELKFNDGSDTFIVNINESVDPGVMSSAIENIVHMVTYNDYAYELFDILMAYYIIDLFTDIPIPSIKDEDGESAPDYARCYEICIGLNLINELCNASPIISDYVEFIEKNVWRRLEYKKSVKTNEALTLLYDKAYELLDDVENMMAKTKDVDLNAIANEIGKISELPIMKELQDQ